MQHDTRPAFARYFWRDHTREHWAYSLAVDAVSTIMFQITVLGLLYVTRYWWAPTVLGFLCQ